MNTSISNIQYFIKKYQINYFLLLLIAFFISSYRQIMPPLILLLFFFSLFNFSSINYKKNNHKILFFTIISYFLYSALSLLWSSNVLNGLKELETILSIIIFPIITILSPTLKKKHQINILKSHILGTLFSFSIQIAIATYRAYIIKEPFPINCIHCESILSFYFYTELSHFIHPSYASLFSLFSIVSILLIVFKHNESKKWLLLIFIYLTIIYLYSSKAGFLALFFISFLSLIYLIVKTKKIKFSVIGTVIFISLSFFIFNSKRVQTLLSERKINIKKSENDEKTDVRILIWQSHFELIEENFFWGTGIGDYSFEIVNKYKITHFDAGVHSKFGAHNQFLMAFSSLGILGFISIFAIFFISFLYSLKEKNLIGIAFLIITSINFLFESMLMRQHGVVFFSFFFAFLFINSDKEEFIYAN